MIRTLSACENLLFCKILKISQLNNTKIITNTLFTKIILYIGKLFTGDKVYAVTLGNRIYFENNPYTASFICFLGHECVHIYQFNQNPCKFLILYCWDIITKGYLKNRYEIEAYNKEEELYNVLINNCLQIYELLRQNNLELLKILLKT